MFANFEEMVQAAKKNQKKRVVAVAGAADEAVIESVLRAKEEGVAEPILVGDAKKIEAALIALGQKVEDFRIEDCAFENIGQRAVELVQDGEADFLMKGMIDTKDILKPVVSKENRLRTGRVMSHISLNEVPGYHKLLGNTDGGMLVYPDLEQKKAIIENATEVLHNLGYEDPKFAVLCAVEKLNPKMTECVDADALQKMNENGEIAGCKVVGPISYDVAMDKHIAEHKKFECEYCGDFDVLVMPNMAAGNIFGKTLTVTVGAKMAGIIIGAKCPIVLTSRGSSPEEKYLSIVLAGLAATGV
ncbi:MAG: phosphate butyryltransferase [Erysipelotrichaceae bacterium]|nr:phosphate butyryltransferase [Erysipelotrichaceae bacterium]